MSEPHDAPHAGSPASAAQPGAAGAAAPTMPATGDAPVVTHDQVKMALRRVKDPELNLNVVDLGLIYGIDVNGSQVRVDMSLTSPGCPSGPQIMGDVEGAIRAIAGVQDVEVNLVWEPLWGPDRIEPRVRAYLGF